MKYKLLLFDADDTLFDYGKAEEQALALAFGTADLVYKKAIHLELYRTVNLQVWEEYGQGAISAGELRTKRFDLMFRQAGISFDSEQFSQTYLGHLSQAAYLLDGAETILEYLAQKYTLALVTNGLAEVQQNRFQRSLSHWFSHLIVSEETGSQKPNVKFFDFALKKIGPFHKKETLMIGDSLQSDIQGGINFSIDTCWFNPKGDAVPEDIKPTYVIKKLVELRSIL